jgi:uncharacterized protein
MKCFFHSADLDGHCSGAIVKHRFPACEMIGIDYGQPFPFETVKVDETVYMVDFSLQPFEEMVELNSICNLTWIDHHKSAMLDWEEWNRPIKEAYLQSDHAACELAWNHLFGHLPMPKAVFWLGRYDIWKHKENPGSLEFQYGMRIVPNTSPDNQDFWKELFSQNDLTFRLRDQGLGLLTYEKNQNTKFISAYGFYTELDGLKCIAANRGMSNSLLFESVWNHEMYDAMLMFAWKNGQWTISLYTDKPGIDVSKVAKARGGGGHIGAAGFQCKELPF